MSSPPELNVLLVGCGKMGGALLQRWQVLELCKRIIVVERNSPLCDVPARFVPDLIVFALKPQTLAEVITDYLPYAQQGIPFLSIAAGKPISFFEKHLGKNVKIIRAMPNTPAAIGKGITVSCVNQNVSTDEKNAAHVLLSAVGDVIWVEDEKLINPATALSGSGPAYVFLLIEILTKAGIHIGLSAVTAEKLARQTVIGSAALAESNMDIPAAILRDTVTSPNGTTQAALNVLMSSELQSIFNHALTSATKRAEELAID